MLAVSRTLPPCSGGAREDKAAVVNLLRHVCSTIGVPVDELTATIGRQNTVCRTTI